MSRHLRHLAPALLLGGAAALAAGRGAEPGPAVGPRYGDVTWSELAFSAHKFFLSASTTIRIERVAAATAAGQMATVPRGEAVPVPAGGAAAITVDTALPFGRDESVTLLFDPATGAALGGRKTTRGRGAYHKLLRYTGAGLFTVRSAPANGREAALPPEEWTRRKAYLVEPATAPPPGAPVVDSYALIYLVSAAHLDREGDASRVYMLADDRFVELAFVAGSLTYHRVDFEERWPGGRRHREGKVLVREVRVTARPLGGDDNRGGDVDLGFLGMRGSLTVLLEQGSDLPLALAGRVEHIGELTVRLDRAVLTSAPPPPQP